MPAPSLPSTGDAGHATPTDTPPAGHARQAAPPDEPAACRLTSRWEIAGWLGELGTRQAPLEMRVPDGTAACPAFLEPFDPRQDRLVFRVDLDAPHVSGLTEADEVLVTGHLDGVRLQFAIRHVVEVRASTRRELRTTLPDELHRWQRREAFRVRTRQHTAPMARLATSPGPIAAVRVLDVSIGGCSLFVPHDLPVAAPGALLRGVELDLDADTRVHIDLRVLRTMPPEPEARGARVGCAFVDPPAAALRALQRFIDATQKRGRLLAGV